MAQEERRRFSRRRSDECNVTPHQVSEIFLRLQSTCNRIKDQQEAQKLDHDILMQRTSIDPRVDKLESKIDSIIEYQNNASGAARFVLWSTAVLAALASTAAFIWKQLPWIN